MPINEYNYNNTGIIIAMSGVSYLLDDYPSAAAAYSLRLLKSNYSGNAIKVRRSSDNAELDIGFSNNVLDESALTTFVGANDGFVTTWYDQSGNSVNAAQSTASSQPKIVSSGVVSTTNGKPSIIFDGVNDSLIQSVPVFTGVLSYFNVLKLNSLPTHNPPIGGYNESGFGSVIGDVFGAFRFQAGNNTTNITYRFTTDQKLYNVIRDSGNQWYARQNASVIGNSNRSGTINLQAIGARLPSNPTYNLFFNGDNQEVILYATDEQSNQTGIETNINSFYSIY